MEVLALIIAVIALVIAVASFVRTGGIREIKGQVQTLSSTTDSPDSPSQNLSTLEDLLLTDGDGFPPPRLIARPGHVPPRDLR
mgnify:CR=1 FL=1